MDADAYATAFMEMGIKIFGFFRKNEDNLEVMFVYLDSLSNDMMEFRTDGFTWKIIILFYISHLVLLHKIDKVLLFFKKDYCSNKFQQIHHFF